MVLCSDLCSSFVKHCCSLNRIELLLHAPLFPLQPSNKTNIKAAKPTDWSRDSSALPRASSVVLRFVLNDFPLRTSMYFWLASIYYSIFKPLSLSSPSLQCLRTPSPACCSPAAGCRQPKLSGFVVLLHLLLIFPGGCKADTSAANKFFSPRNSRKPSMAQPSPLDGNNRHLPTSDSGDGKLMDVLMYLRLASWASAVLMGRDMFAIKANELAEGFFLPFSPSFKKTE